MSNVEFENAIPAEFVLAKPTSTSRAILRKNLMEILPNEQTTFDPTGNSIMRFQVSSNSDVLSGPESYFRFDFEQTTASQDGNVLLDVGGIHCLFKNIEIRAIGSGILLQRYDAYNKYNAMQSLLLDDPNTIEFNAWPNLDSMPDNLNDVSYRDALQALTGTYAVATTGVITGTSSLLETELAEGDQIYIYGDAAGEVHVGFITSVTDEDTAEVSPAPAVAITAGAVMYKLAADSSSSLTPRARAGTGSKVTVTVKPNLSLLQHYLPLFLLSGGIEFSFELELAGRAFMGKHSASYIASESDDAMGYQITNPRMYAMMITPHPDIADEYVRQWQSADGLIYEIPSVRYRRYTGTATDQNVTISINPGVRSARKVYMVVQDSSLAEGSSTSSVANLYPACSEFQRDLITSFQVLIGSSEYPNRAIVLQASSDALATASVQESLELREQLKQVSGNAGPNRISWSDWRDAYPIVTVTTSPPTYESRHLIFGVDLSRDNGVNGSLTGTDLSVVPMLVQIERSAAHNDSSRMPGSPLHHFFILHDSFLKISSSQVSVMN